MLVQTSRFGQIQTSQEEVIVFPQGLIGFEATRHWVIVPDPANSDVAWLQSLNEANVALPLISPRKFATNFKLQVSKRDLAPLAIRNSDRIFILSVVSKSGKTLTMNLRSPIVINLTKRIACQVIASEPLPLALPIELPSANTEKRAAA